MKPALTNFACGAMLRMERASGRACDDGDADVAANWLPGFCHCAPWRLPN